jgi:hypothetical protein
MHSFFSDLCTMKRLKPIQRSSFPGTRSAPVRLARFGLKPTLPYAILVLDKPIMRRMNDNR